MGATISRWAAIVRRNWADFWFEPTPPTDLGVCRIIFFGALFWLYRRVDFSAWAKVSPSFWMPIALFRGLRLNVLPASVLARLQMIWQTLLALSCVGLFTRVSTAGSFLLGTYLLGLRHNFGKTHHSDALLVFILGIMALARCGDACSADRLLRQAKGRGSQTPRQSALSGEYTWPIRLVWLLFSIIFFSAGSSKLQVGRAWVAPENLAARLLQHQHHLSTPPLTPWGPWVARQLWLCRLLALMTIGLEVGYPLTLFRREARWLLVPGGFGLLVGIRALMGPVFRSFLLCHLFWVPWRRLGRVLAAPLRRIARPTDATPGAAARSSDRLVVGVYPTTRATAVEQPGQESTR